MTITKQELDTIRKALHLFYTNDIMNRMSDKDMDKVEDAQVIILNKLKEVDNKNRKAQMLMAGAKRYENGKDK